MADESIKPGDTVKLKSGGPLMTVNHETAKPGNWVCAWFTGAENKEAVFAAVMLEKRARASGIED